MNHIVLCNLARKFLIAGMGLLLIISCQRPDSKKFTVMKGNFIQSVTEAGELEAINSASIMMPKINHRYGYSFKLVGLVDYGSIVEVGDSVAALDPSSIYKYIIQQEEALENAKAKAEKQQVESNIQRRDLEVQLKNEEASYNLKKLELERMQFDSGLKKRVKELEYQMTGLKLEKIRDKLALFPQLDAYDHRINELQIKQLETDIQNALETLQNLVLYSTGNGYFQISNNRRGGQSYKLGDEVYMGSMIASIPDVTQMKVSSRINETDISNVHTGMDVVIRLDALPDISFRGVLQEISSICTEEDEQKIFTTEVRVLDNDTRLKPGMSVSCEYISFESGDVLYVPNECLLSERGKIYLFAKRGNKYRKTEVEAGMSNSNYTIILTKLKAGRELLSLEG